ncbi:MAG: hypothetical protein D6820_03955 [Lentisphaerae bacterium]|nr:MAG: hypothetical protein D6820_03955 [Lentisphaerota bacterium]
MFQIRITADGPSSAHHEKQQITGKLISGQCMFHWEIAFFCQSRIGNLHQAHKAMKTESLRSNDTRPQRMLIIPFYPDNF